MSDLTKNILKTGNDNNIKIVLSNEDSFYDKNDELTLQINDLIYNSINEPVDNEIILFKHKKTVEAGTIIFFNFSGNTGGIQSYADAGFTMEEINNYSLNNSLSNSYYIFNIFDGTNIANSKLLSRTYNQPVKYPIFNLDRITPFSRLNIPNWFIQEKKLLGDDVIVYGRFNFYNAKTGKLLHFYNKKEGLDHYKIKLYLTDNTWEIIFPFVGLIQIVEETTNTNYHERFNEKLNNFDIKKKNFKEGSYFDPQLIKYMNIDD